MKEEIIGLPYNDRHSLDLYLPSERGNAPAVVVIHGGGWCTQSKDGAREKSIARDLAAAGFVAASIDYTLVDLDSTQSADEVWPRMLKDCVDAVRFLKNGSAKYGVDPPKIGVIGGSAGGHLASLLGLAPMSTFGISSRFEIDAVCNLYGIGDLFRWAETADESLLALSAAQIMFGGKPSEQSNAYKSASPITYAGPDSPPQLIVHGELDTTISPDHSRWYHDALTRAGAPADLIIVPGASHSFDLRPEGYDLKREVVGFFRKKLAD